MGLYTKVGSTTQEITQLSVNVDGVAKNVQSIYTSINGVKTRVFPTTEIWTLVYEGTNPGSYTYNADWGSYQIVLSGGGGAGAAIANTHSTSSNWANNGSRAEEINITTIVYQNESKLLTGVIGSGGLRSYAYAVKNRSPVATLGTGGTGYSNGYTGTSGTYGPYFEDTSAAAGGAGGGSSSILIDGALFGVAKGGNGGNCSAHLVGPRYGGAGGSGGTTTGTGAVGGNGAQYKNGGGYSGAGSNGYVRIYKSNILPEPTVVLNLTGAQQYVEDTVFPAGRYRITINAGDAYSVATQSSSSDYYCYGAGRIIKTITVANPFIIRAYCGSAAGSNIAGTNPYSGTYKVNPSGSSSIPTVNHIFGNSGGAARSQGSNDVLGGGNCLGNGVVNQYSQSQGAGSCLHLMPVGGTFGTDYYFAFHTTASVCGSVIAPGSGSAYGGAGGGGSLSLPGYGGGSTPYGTGGSGSSASGGSGQPGTGIGHGNSNDIAIQAPYFICISKGAAAYFDGTQWVQEDDWTTSYSNGKILIEYYEE